MRIGCLTLACVGAAAVAAPQRLAESQTVPSGFITASVSVFKGLGIDASFWYVGKTKASRGEAFVDSDAASRFTIGVGYTFSN